jgi:ABC-type dipeptide/oligopeptide/nickel transport system permease subunit
MTSIAAPRTTLLGRSLRGSRKMLRSWVTSVALAVVLLTLVAALFPTLFGDASPTVAVPVDRLQPIGAEGHPLGTDQIGRDVAARLAHSARLAWIVGVSVALGSLLLGAALGAAAGYLGGWLDTVSSRAMDGLLAFPPILLALVLAAVLGPSTRTAIIALAIVYTPLVGRVMRAAVLSERALDYVAAARGLGHREWTVLWRHVLPNTMGPLLVVGTIVVSRAIVIESSLSFLGAGTQPPTPSWGLMIAEARSLITTEPHLVLIPAIVLSVTVLAINLLADALSDVLSPGAADAAWGER